MPYALLVPLIAQVGLPLAMKLADAFINKPNDIPTPEEWAALKKHVPFEQLAGPK